MAVVAVLQRRSAKSPPLMQLLRCISLFSAFYGFHFSAKHVPGVLNEVADALFRDTIATHPLVFHRSPSFICPHSSTGCSSPRDRTGALSPGQNCFQLADCGVAESTKKVYESGQRRFLTSASSLA